jgi:hypothetical protein
LTPAGVYIAILPSERLLQLSQITLVSACAVLIGTKISLFDGRFRKNSRRILISDELFIGATWTLFIGFLIITFLTAESIPFINALMGASADDISQQRGEFLKGREGIGIALLYFTTIVTNTVIPYSIVLLYSKNSPWRHLSSVVFFLFCISFMQKGLFLNLILPLAVFFSLKFKFKRLYFITLLAGAIGFLVFSTYLSLQGQSMEPKRDGNNDYLSALYQPQSPLDYFAWRSTAVPIFTAVDTLVVHDEQFEGRLLMGATSSLIASISGIERINLERFVFEHQFGGWNETANANAFYAIDAYVNFGWLGVLFFSIFIGLIFRFFRLSSDAAFASLWPIFALVLFYASLIGMLFSNGFLYMIFHALFLKVGNGRNKNSHSAISTDNSRGRPSAIR